MDLDPLDDIFPNTASKPGARAGGRFQPKAKAKPRPRNPAAAAAAAPDPPSTKSVPISTIPNNNQLIGSTEKQEGQFESNDEHPFYGDINGGDWQSCFVKSSGGENGDIYIGLESFDDYLPQSATTTSTVTESSLPLPETPTIHASDGQNAEDVLMDPELSKTANRCTSPEGPAQLGTLMGEEGAVFNNGGDFHIESRTVETETADDFPCLESLGIMSESTSISGQRIGKFQPKPKLQPCKTKQNAMVPNPEEIESGSLAEDTRSIPSQTEYMVEGSIPSFPEDDVIDFSSIRFSDSIHTDPTSDFQVNEETTNWTGTSQADAALPGEQPEAVSEMYEKRTKRGRRNVSMTPGPSLEHQNASTSAPEDQVRRSSERLRKRINTFELLDESEDEDCDDGYELENEDNHNIDAEYVVENESLNERPRSRSKKPAAEKEKPVRNRKKANGETVEPTKALKKKFCHTTRRNRRRVNSDLLNIPEDEIDFQNMPLKTRIWLAEHKERMAKNESTTSETPIMNQGAASFSGYHDEDEASQGRDSADEYANSIVPETSTGFNYRTHMKITPRTRWSKQDTELFYEVLQQFGSDLTMIAECFPGRTRHQIKLKYKNEERRNPSRLHDALATRSKGSSHFQVVIERLQQIASQKQDDNRDDPINLTGEEAEEVAADTNEAAKSELREEEVQDMEPKDVPAVESSLKSDDSEDDLYRWSQYKSEI